MAVKFNQIQTICITVSNDDGSFPRLPSDPDGILGKLRTFLIENEITPNVRGGMSGPTMLIAFYSPEDAAKIVEFLKTINVEEET